MTPLPKLLIIFTFILLFFSALFSSFETAITSCDYIKFKSQNKKSKMYKKTLYFMENIDDVISRILVLNNLVNSLYATLVTVYITNKFDIKFLSLGIMLSAIILFIFGEMIPKMLALIFKNKFLILTTLLSYPFIIAIKPISDFFYKVSKSIVNLILRDKKEETLFSEEDVKSIVNNAISDGNLTCETKELIDRAFEFDDKNIYSIMQPWEKVAKLEYNENPRKTYEKLKNEEYTRLPVIDYKGNIIGIYNIKKFLQEYFDKKDELNPKDVIFEPFFIDYDSKIDHGLKYLSENRVHMAFVRKDSKVCGIVTIEDILEELVGEIKDEEE